MPTRAHIICTILMSSHVNKAVYKGDVPSCAPAMEPVATPVEDLIASESVLLSRRGN